MNPINEVSRTLQLFRRRAWDVAGLVFAVLALPGGIYAVLALNALLGASDIRMPTIVAAIVVAAICLKFIVDALRKVAWSGPVLVLDAQGVTDLWLGKATVPWATIARYSLNYGGC